MKLKGFWVIGKYLILQCKVDSDPNQMYEYDDLYRLTAVDYNDGSTESYVYDNLGNRNTMTIPGSTVNYGRNNVNQYTNVGGTGYSYDDNGNLTSDGTYTYNYNYKNQLISVYEGQTKLGEYWYDHQGRRIRRYHYNGSSGTYDKYTYDGDRMIVMHRLPGRLIMRKFIYGLGIDEPICMIDVADNNAVYYYHSDGLGSVAALSDSNKDMVERYTYTVFGEPNTTSGIGNPYMFTGRRYDYESKLYYYRARHYNTAIGKFMQADPVAPMIQKLSVEAVRSLREGIAGTYVWGSTLQRYMQNDPIGRFLTADPAGRYLQNYANTGFAAELNLYTYCYNNPLMYMDPYGLNWFAKWTGAVVGGCTGAAAGIATGNPYVGVVTGVTVGMLTSAGLEKCAEYPLPTTPNPNPLLYGITPIYYD